MINSQRVIAVEEHFATSDYLQVSHGLDVWPGDQPEMKLMHGLENTDPLRRKLTDFDARLQEMEACGIDMTVLSLNPPGVQPYDEKSAVPLARDFNDGLVEIIRRWPGRFAGLGTIAPQDPKQAARAVYWSFTKRAAATALTRSISVRQLRRGGEHLHVRPRPVYQA